MKLLRKDTEKATRLRASLAHIPDPSTDAAAPLALLARCPEAAETPLVDAPDLARLASVATVSIKDERARISPAYVAEAAVKIGQSDTCEAVFLSCTNLRTLDIIDEIEARIDKPVLSSNQVLAWHLCRLSGCTPPPSAPGRLFQAI